MQANEYDVVVIGAGPSGIFCAYELVENRPDLKVLVIEKGRPIEKRVCPKRRTTVCQHCNPCAITTGFAGAGGFWRCCGSMRGSVSGSWRTGWGFVRLRRVS